MTNIIMTIPKGIRWIYGRWFWRCLPALAETLCDEPANDNEIENIVA